MTENNLEPKKIFQFKIEKYYFELAGNQIPTYLLTELIEKITEIQYENYKRYWNQYPKSRKRFSALKIEDLKHPFTYYAITDFLKLKDFENYRKYTMTLLKMTEKEFGDYKIMRESITKLSCKTFDSLTVVETNLALKNMDTNLFDKNVDIYYRDLGWSYYRLFLKTKDTVLIRNSVDSYLKANLYKPNSSATLWQLASLNCIIGNCATGKQFFENYKSVTEKKYWREDEIISMTKRCDN